MSSIQRSYRQNNNAHLTDAINKIRPEIKFFMATAQSLDDKKIILKEFVSVFTNTCAKNGIPEAMKDILDMVKEEFPELNDETHKYLILL